MTFGTISTCQAMTYPGDIRLWYDNLPWTGFVINKDGVTLLLSQGLPYTGYASGALYLKGHLNANATGWYPTPRGQEYFSSGLQVVPVRSVPSDGPDARGFYWQNGKKHTGKGSNGLYYTDGIKRNGVYEGRLYLMGRAASDCHDGYYYVDGLKFTGSANNRLYRDGLPFTGLNKQDGLVYSDGRPACCRVGDRLYNKGRPAEGLLALRSGVTKMFENGRLFTGRKDGLYYEDGLAPNFLDSEMMAAQRKVERQFGKFHLTPQEKAQAWRNAPTTVNPRR